MFGSTFPELQLGSGGPRRVCVPRFRIGVRKPNGRVQPTATRAGSCLLAQPPKNAKHI
jgi:hypothetical protein